MNDILTTDEIAAIAKNSLQLGRYSALAGYALFVYDWLISIADEHELILTARRSSMQTAYLVCRYIPLVIFPFYLWAWLGDHSADFCAKMIQPMYGFMVVFQLSAQIVILLRTYAFTGRKMAILIVLALSLVALGVAEIWLFGTRFILAEQLYVYLGDSGCFANAMDAQISLGRSQSAGLVMLGAFLMDLTMMFIVFFHCLRLRSVQGELGRSFLIQGFFAFVFMSAFNLVQAIIYFGSHPEYDGIGLPLVLLLSDVMACRLILALRRKVKPTESQILRQQSILVREAFELLRMNSPTPDEQDDFDPWAP